MQKLILFRDRVKNKIRTLLYHKILYRYGFGNRVAKSTWDKQFAQGDWDYLTTEAEEAHYKVIIEFYKKYAAGKKVLDVGCGKGVLYNYLSSDNKDFNYLGIDISSSAITQAKKTFPYVDFRELDFDKRKLEETFEVIIFNETLYYFNRPMKKIASCIQGNLSRDGLLIISMCDYFGHNYLWERLISTYQMVERRDVANELGQRWTIVVIKP